MRLVFLFFFNCSYVDIFQIALMEQPEWLIVKVQIKESNSSFSYREKEFFFFLQDNGSFSVVLVSFQKGYDDCVYY